MTGLAILAAALTNLSGIVTFEREGLPFYFVDDERGAHWRVARTPEMKASVGDRVEVRGVREPSVKPRIADATVTVTGRDPAALPPPRKISIADLFAGIMPYGNPEWYGGMMETEGLLRDINRRQSTTQLLVGEGDDNLQVEIPWALEDALPDDLLQGARVRVVGALAYTSIENVDEGVFGRIENVELIPASGAAVKVVKTAPFWTTSRLLALFGGLLALVAAVSAWALTLRRMVARRTRELGESIRQRETARIEADATRRERLRLAADLHDGFQQYLAGAMFRLKAAMNYLPKEAVETRVQLEKVNDALKHTQSGLRSTLWAMNEESEGPESLVELFNFVARRMSHWEGVVEIGGAGAERQVARKAAGTLLLILQEAVGNAIRHGGARHVKVLVAFGDEGLTLSVRDDGRGFDPAVVESGGHYGMESMRRRARDLGGDMKVESSPGKGAKLVFSIPLEADSPSACGDRPANS